MNLYHMLLKNHTEDGEGKNPHEMMKGHHPFHHCHKGDDNHSHDMFFAHHPFHHFHRGPFSHFRHFPPAKMFEMMRRHHGGSWDFNFHQNAKANIIEQKDKYIIELEVPGFEKEDVKINIVNDILTIEAKKELEDIKEESFLLQERQRKAEIKRQFQLSASLEHDSIQAKLEKGLLKVTILKTEKAKGKEIDIQ